jgi:hypothetical protein
MSIVEDPTAIIKCRTAVQVLFLYLNLRLSVTLNGLSCPFTSILFLTNTVGTVPKFNRKILEKDKCNTPNTQTHDGALSRLDTGTSIKRSDLKLVICVKTVIVIMTITYRKRKFLFPDIIPAEICVNVFPKGCLKIKEQYMFYHNMNC